MLLLLLLLLILLLLSCNSPTKPGPPHSWGIYVTPSDTPQSVGLLWASDRPVAETSTLQHTQETDVHASGWIRTRSPSKRAATDPLRRWASAQCITYTKYELVCLPYLMWWIESFSVNRGSHSSRHRTQFWLSASSSQVSHLRVRRAPLFFREDGHSFMPRLSSPLFVYSRQNSYETFARSTSAYSESQVLDHNGVLEL